MRYVLKAILLAPAVSMAAAPLADTAPTLRLAQQLTFPATPVTTAERTVLRVEWQAALSATTERAAVSDLLDRIHKASDDCAEIRKLLVALPDSLPAAPPAAGGADTRRPPPPAESQPAPDEASAEADDLSPTLIGGGVLAAIGLAWVWLRRRRHRMGETAIAATVMMPYGHERTTITEAESPEALATWPPEPHAEIAPTTETGETAHRLADTMMAIGLNESAARSLEHHIRSHPSRALSHWLRLLDLYRQSGLHAEFDQAAERLCRQYNIAMPDWQSPATGTHQNSLESFPHVRARLTDLWPTAECADYLQQLLEDNREGTRQGFDRKVIEEILALQAIRKVRQAGLSMSTN